MACGQDSIVLKKDVVAKPQLTLADIALIHIKNVKLAAYIEQIPIDTRYIEDNYISKEEVYKVLEENFLDTNKIEIQGAGIRILHKKMVVTKNDLITALMRYIKSHYKNIEVERISFVFKEFRPQGYFRLQLLPTSDTFNHIYFVIKIYDAQGLVKRINVNVKVKRYASLYIAKRFIPKGTIISQADIALQRIRIKNAHLKRLNKEDIIGAVARQNISANKVIKEYMIVPNFPVKRSKNVKIVYKRGGIHIELLGLALENGKRGDIIRVKNLSSNKVLQCKVISDGVVQYLY